MKQGKCPVVWAATGLALARLMPAFPPFAQL